MGAPSITLPDAHRVTSSGTMVPDSPDGSFWQVREDAHPAKSTATLSSGVPMPSLRFHTVRKRLFPPVKT